LESSQDRQRTRETRSQRRQQSEFIRRQPTTLSATEVVAKGKAAGIKFGTQLVYNVRRGSKATKGTVKKTTAAKPSAEPSLMIASPSWCARRGSRVLPVHSAPQPAQISTVHVWTVVA
jgi:hypothetical protein